MIVHFICRGNAFRSIIAETYMRSLNLDGVKVFSSGTVAKQYESVNVDRYKSILELLDRHHLLAFAKNHYADPLNSKQAGQADITVCMNQLVYDEASRICKLPQNTFIWNVTDIGETGRIARSSMEQHRFEEDAFIQITHNVDHLVKSLGVSQKTYQSSEAKLH